MKVNSSNSLSKENCTFTALTGSVSEAIRLGCSAVGFTIYPGSDMALDMISDIQEIAREAKNAGLAVVVWSYPRGGDISKEGETAIDIVSYAAHMAALVGAHIIKVKPPTSYIEQDEAKKVYETENIPINSLNDRIKQVVNHVLMEEDLLFFQEVHPKIKIAFLMKLENYI